MTAKNVKNCVWIEETVCSQHSPMFVFTAIVRSIHFSVRGKTKSISYNEEMKAMKVQQGSSVLSVRLENISSKSKCKYIITLPGLAMTSNWNTQEKLEHSVLACK